MGFRFQACRLAQSLELTGWVTNLGDGRVEMEAQGEEPVVWNLLSALTHQPYIRIDDVDISDLPLKENEKTFHW